MARNPPWIIYYNSFGGKLFDSFINATAIAKYDTLRRMQTTITTDNGVRDGRYNIDQSLTPTLYRAAPPKRHLHNTNRCNLCRESNPLPYTYEGTHLLMRLIFERFAYHL